MDQAHRCDELLAAYDSGFASGYVKGRARAHNAVALVAQLTPRQQDVLSGIARGRPYKLIAHDLAISIRTVEIHAHSAFKRLGVKSRFHAALIGVDAGLGEQ